MTVTLCLRPQGDEPVVSTAYALREPRTVLAVAARHLVERVELDPAGTPTVWFAEATERARPVHVRIELAAAGRRAPAGGIAVGRLSGPDGEIGVYGTYLGPVSDEN